MEVKYKSIRNEVQVLQYDLETERKKAEENFQGMKEEMLKNGDLEEEIKKLREKTAAPVVDQGKERERGEGEGEGGRGRDEGKRKGGRERER